MNKAPVSVVVPAYNSEASLPLLAERLSSVFAADQRAFELILVDDGSRDRTWDVIQQLADGSRVVRGFRMARNYGQHNALLCGIRAARYAIVVTLDDDLQNPPEEAPRLLAKLEEGFDVVYGTPLKQAHGFWRDIASVATKMVLQSALGAETARKVSPFRAFRTKVRAAFQDYRGSNVSIDVLLTWGARSFTAIEVRNDPRPFGASNYTLMKLIRHALDIMTGFSTLPLQAATIVGFVFTLFGIVLLAWILGRYMILGYSVPGFPFLGSAIAIFSGAQLFALGVIGEYIARIHVRVMGRPSYAIEAETGDGQNVAATDQPVAIAPLNQFQP